MAARPPVCDFGWKAPDFSLPSTTGEVHTLHNVKGENGCLIMFICNHRPYVVSVIDRIVSESRELQSLGIGVAAICSNDAINYPDDSFPKMKTFAEKYGFTFPYLHDESQRIAETYGAVCTPDFFGFNAKLELQYRGRLDDAGRQSPSTTIDRELYNAMTKVAETGQGPTAQIASMGCSIKWKM